MTDKQQEVSEETLEPWVSRVEHHKLKKLDLKHREFEANGKQYHITGQLTAERWQKMQELQIEIGFGASYKELYEGLRDVYDIINSREGRLADAAVYIDTLLNKTATLEQRYLPVLKYCACFILREDERIVDFSEKVVDEKILDWKEEGIDINSFFSLAVNMVRGLKENYLNDIQDTSQSQTQEKT